MKRSGHPRLEETRSHSWLAPWSRQNHCNWLNSKRGKSLIYATRQKLDEITPISIQTVCTPIRYAHFLFTVVSWGYCISHFYLYHRHISNYFQICLLTHYQPILSHMNILSKLRNIVHIWPFSIISSIRQIKSPPDTFLTMISHSVLSSTMVFLWNCLESF